MKPIMRVTGLAKEWNGNRLFAGVSMEVARGERLALFGSNGSGKTTLLRLLLGDEPPSDGHIDRLLPLEQWGWLKQEDYDNRGLTALEAAQAESKEHWQVKREMQQQESILAQLPERDAAEAMLRYGELLNQYEQLEGFVWEAEIEKVLTRVGLPAAAWSIPYADLSGGQKTRVRLAGLMVSRPQLLLLDEPTNHLDSDSLIWLEEWLCRFDGTLIFVSHDRVFLDKVATSICELTPQGVNRYKGGYTNYRLQKEHEWREQEALYRKQELARKALEQTIRQYSEWFDRAHNAASKVEVGATKSYYKARANKNISRFHAKEKELERLEDSRVDQPRDAKVLNMKLQDGGFLAKHLLRMEHVKFYYGSHCILQDMTLNIGRGERLAVRGANGTGKTTLLKLITGELTPEEGKIIANPQLKIGYFSQELENLPVESTLLDSLLTLPSMTQTEARTVLGCFLFPREDVFKKIGQLSMGEKCRVAFLRLYFSGSNLLVLDEPTNYFDIDTREMVESALMNYKGALVIVSHDRELIRKTSTRLLDLVVGGHYTLYEGTVEEKEEALRNQQQDQGSSHQQEEKIRLEWRLTELLGMSDTDSDGTLVLKEIRSIQARLMEWKP